MQDFDLSVMLMKNNIKPRRYGKQFVELHE